ncbi:hypothetical protein [Virgisporangium aurantiacum]|uniref:Uncharacterized protein n=1 Tax=Virgisporangium aurantiacum TaxID=175570 RepID=A0A8J3Z896_9ACTN|nr:hypothetical protein [Virgisporangium aurantiacum]GIJ57135.1 hypothetical protein Vau01_046510 [Virgisporangium aurantiacum]
MITRRGLLAGAASAGAFALVPAMPGTAGARPPRGRTGPVSANGWRIDPAEITAHRVAGSAATVLLRGGAVAAVLLHVARRWHYEIARLDTGEGGGVAGYMANRAVRADFESNYLSGTAVAMHPTAYPLGGSEPLSPHHEAIVADILVDCAGTVVWGGHLAPVAASHFHIAHGPDDRTLARVGARLDASRHAAVVAQTAGAVADPAAPARRELARRVPSRR